MKANLKLFLLSLMYFILIAISSAIISNGIVILLKEGTKKIIGLPLILIILGVIGLYISIQNFFITIGVKSITKR